MARRNIFVGIPTRSSDVKVQMTASLVSAVYELGVADMAMDMFVWSGDPLISHARNVILAQFLTTDCSDLVFVDDDVSWEPGALLKLVSHPVDLVAGSYRHKKDEETYPVNWMPHESGLIQGNPNTGLLAVNDVPFGFTRLTRSCVQRMYDAAKDKPFSHKNTPNLDTRVVFDIVYDAGQYYGEDYVFCQKWRAMGGTVWLDPEMALNHTGTKVYEGHLGNWLRAQQETPGQAAMREVANDLKGVSAA